jgi:hypothetical protein
MIPANCESEKDCDYQPWCRINGACQRATRKLEVDPVEIERALLRDLLEAAWFWMPAFNRVPTDRQDEWTRDMAIATRVENIVAGKTPPDRRCSP